MYHHSVGPHHYEDDGQQNDHDYHMHAEVEREHVERIQAYNHRKGSTVRFDVGEKRPVYFKHNI